MQEDGAYVTYTPPGGADAVTKKLGSSQPVKESFSISNGAAVHDSYYAESNDSGHKAKITTVSNINSNTIYAYGWDDSTKKIVGYDLSSVGTVIVDKLYQIRFYHNLSDSNAVITVEFV